MFGRRREEPRLSRDASRILDILDSDGIDQLPPPFHAARSLDHCPLLYFYVDLRIFVDEVQILAVKWLSTEGCWVEETETTEEFREELEIALRTAEVVKEKFLRETGEGRAQKVRDALAESGWSLSRPPPATDEGGE